MSITDDRVVYTCYAILALLFCGVIAGLVWAIVQERRGDFDTPHCPSMGLPPRLYPDPRPVYGPFLEEDS